MPPPLPWNARQAAARSPQGSASDRTATPDQFDKRSQAYSSREAEFARNRTYSRWVAANSTWVNRMRFDPQFDFDGDPTGQGTITIEFLDLSMFEYEGRSTADWLDILESSSKGRYAYYVILKRRWPYTQLKKASRTSREVHEIAEKRNPRTKKQKRRTFTVGGQRNAFGKGGKRLKKRSNGSNVI